MVINTTLNYSPNFNPKKRKFNQIKFIIFHYTGMINEKTAINHLTKSRSKVSSHYFIKKNGKIITLVPELYTAWHAGVSSWKNFKYLNKYSIGIEISNPGHDYKYKNFSNEQIKSIIILGKYLIKKYKIKFKFILGHSDIAPERKKDPGEKFPWKQLSRKKIGLWHSLDQKKLVKYRGKKLNVSDQNRFIKNLYKIGYPKNLSKKITFYNKKLTLAFQRRFRQKITNGIIDQECLLISENLIKKFV